MDGNVRQRHGVPLGAGNHLDDLDVLVKHTSFPLYDVASEETIGHNRRANGHPSRTASAPVLGQGAQPLVVRDQFAVEQELAKSDRF